MIKAQSKNAICIQNKKSKNANCIEGTKSEIAYHNAKNV